MLPQRRCSIGGESKRKEQTRGGRPPPSKLISQSLLVSESRERNPPEEKERGSNNQGRNNEEIFSFRMKQVREVVAKPSRSKRHSLNRPVANYEAMRQLDTYSFIEG